MRIGWTAVLLAAGSCAQHCEWTPFVEESSWVTAVGTVTGDDRDEAFDDDDVEVDADGVAALRFEIASDVPDTTRLTLLVWSVPRGTGVHAIDASVILGDGTRIETLGSAMFDAYGEITARNPNDAYTSGGTVTAVQVAGALEVAGEEEGLAVEVALDFEIEEDLRRECFDCPGFEGCDY